MSDPAWIMLSSYPIGHHHNSETTTVHWGSVCVSTNGSSVFGYTISPGTGEDGNDECIPILKQSGLYAILTWIQTSDLAQWASDKYIDWFMTWYMDYNRPGDLTYIGNEPTFFPYTAVFQQYAEWHSDYGPADFAYAWQRILPLQLTGGPLTLGPLTMEYDFPSDSLDEYWQVDLYIVKLNVTLAGLVSMNWRSGNRSPGITRILNRAG
jgi:hypothetical protein